MEMLPIDIDESRNSSFTDDESREVLSVYPAFYQRVGFFPPWIGYFFRQDDRIVGCGGFKGKPVDGKVEVAYGTFREFEGRGIGTQICGALVSLSNETNPKLRIMARTLPAESGSTTILRRNGFRLRGVVHDEEDGDVWEWEWDRVTMRNRS